MDVSILSRPEGREQPIRRYLRPATREFQSSLAPKGESNAEKTITIRISEVSILSRPEGREQRSTIKAIHKIRWFQSSLAPKGESNAAARSPCRRSNGFNPLSPRRARATAAKLLLHFLQRVSILSRPEGREQPARNYLSILDKKFQSSLAPKGESNPQRRHPPPPLSCFNPLSPRRARATKSLHLITYGLGFQSSLAPKGESNRVRQIVDVRSQSFNPLSPRRARATLGALIEWTVTMLFQSSLAPKGESNFFRPNRRRHHSCFNPLSPRRARATQLPRNVRLPLSRFNPLSPRRARATTAGVVYIVFKGVFQSSLAPKGESNAWVVVS